MNHSSNNSILFQVVLIALITQLRTCSFLMDESLYQLDDSSILSKTRNLTVHLNETVHLPCLVKKSPNTVVS